MHIPKYIAIPKPDNEILRQVCMQTGEPQSLRCLGELQHEKSIKYLYGTMGGIIGGNSGTHGYGCMIFIDEEVGEFINYTQEV